MEHRQELFCWQAVPGNLPEEGAGNTAAPTAAEPVANVEPAL
ncbi:MAG: hypothetical protein WBF90_28445 [Rivularia sp. (in: cyanobacteria)]